MKTKFLFLITLLVLGLVGCTRSATQATLPISTPVAVISQATGVPNQQPTPTFVPTTVDQTAETGDPYPAPEVTEVPTQVPTATTVVPTLEPTVVPAADAGNFVIMTDTLTDTQLVSGTEVSQLSYVLGLVPQPVYVKGFENDHEFKSTLPGYIDLRNTVAQPGEVRIDHVPFGVDFDRLVLYRLAADDRLISIVYYPLNGAPVDLTPLLGMYQVTAGCPDVDNDRSESNDDAHRLVLLSRAVNCAQGEELSQNLYSINLGAVEKGSFLRIVTQDDPSLQVNVGPLISFTADTDALTIDLAKLTSLTRLPESLAVAVWTYEALATVDLTDFLVTAPTFTPCGGKPEENPAYCP